MLVHIEDVFNGLSFSALLLGIHQEVGAFKFLARVTHTRV